VRIYFQVELPDALAGEFLQVLRSFDAKHDPQHRDIIRMQIISETDWPIEKAKQMFEALTPPFEHMVVKKSDKDGHA